MTTLKLKKGDMVQVLAGKDVGKKAKILQVIIEDRKAIVEGLNLVSKHQKPKSAQKPGEIIKKESSLHLSKLMLVCPNCQKSTRVGFNFDKAGNKYRFCKACEQPLEK
jgi:large subunit ribosomal protein L24